MITAVDCRIVAAIGIGTLIARIGGVALCGAGCRRYRGTIAVAACRNVGIFVLISANVAGMQRITLGRTFGRNHGGNVVMSGGFRSIGRVAVPTIVTGM